MKSSLGSWAWASRNPRALFRPRPVQSTTISIKNYGTVSEAPANQPSIRGSPSVGDPAKSIFQSAIEAQSPRTNWTRDEIGEIYETPLMKLAFAAV